MPQILTEDEARTKWCPYARISGQNGGGSRNRSELDDGAALRTCLCIASACMLWGWVTAVGRASDGQVQSSDYPHAWPDGKHRGRCDAGKGG